MAEIKSTLDIIMEKTRGLTMTDEEKAAMHDRELEGKTRGLVQKYLDGTIPMAKFQKEWDRLGKDREKALTILKRICVENVEPEGENGPLLELLRDVAGMESDSLERALERAREDLDTRRLESQERIREALAESGIYGSAALPNLNADPQWKEIVFRQKERLHDELLSLLHI